MARTLAGELRKFGVAEATSASRSLIHFAEPGTALTLAAPHRRFGTQPAEFLGHVGDGRHILVSKHISGMWSSRWTKPIKVPFGAVVAVHDRLARQ